MNARITSCTHVKSHHQLSEEKASLAVGMDDTLHIACTSPKMEYGCLNGGIKKGHTHKTPLPVYTGSVRRSISLRTQKERKKELGCVPD